MNEIERLKYNSKRRRRLINLGVIGFAIVIVFFLFIIYVFYSKSENVISLSFQAKNEKIKTLDSLYKDRQQKLEVTNKAFVTEALKNYNLIEEQSKKIKELEVNNLKVQNTLRHERKKVDSLRDIINNLPKKKRYRSGNTSE